MRSDTTQANQAGPRWHLTPVSGNGKTGPIAVSTSPSTTCPPGCPAWQACYAKQGPLAMHWKALDKGERGQAWPEFIRAVHGLPRWQMFRGAQAGDLPGQGEDVDGQALAEMTQALANMAAAWTYTHKPLTAQNLAAIRAARAGGYTINASCDTLAQVDQAVGLGLDAVVILNEDAPAKSMTPGGVPILACPEQTGAVPDCARCGSGRPLCARQNRRYAIGFYLHGPGRKRYLRPA